jgi:hypothetical protein
MTSMRSVDAVAGAKGVWTQVPAVGSVIETGTGIGID